MKKATLAQILKTYDSILWYPSAGTDFSIADVFSPESLNSLCIERGECPDCFLMTDYDADYLFKAMFQRTGCGDDAYVVYSRSGCVITAFNGKRLPDINVGYDPYMISDSGDSDLPEHYGAVLSADILIEYSNGNRFISKLIYAAAENTRFLYDYLLKNKIGIKYLVRSCYGYGFGDGNSTGSFLRHTLKDLGVKYFADDMNAERDNRDVASHYLTSEQRETVPVLEKEANLTSGFGFRGYGDVILYRVKGFETRTDAEHSPIL